jgi:plastocyanin
MRRAVLSLAVVTLAAVAAWSCSSSSSPTPVPRVEASPTPAPSPSPAAAGTVTISIVSDAGAMSFSPEPASVKVGQAVVWRNADSITHTATQNGGGFNTGNIAPGATSNPITMTSAGSLAYHCQIHPGMVGTLTVTP